MEIKWEHEGNTYTVYRRNNGELYINHIPLLSNSEKILEGLNSDNLYEVENTRRFAESIYNKEDKKIIEWTYKMHRKYFYKHVFNDFVTNLPFILLCIACFALLAGILYLIYQVWWFFVGYSAFEGPFADEYSAGETTADTIILFIVLIVVIEEVVRRIRNGHF